MCGSAEGVKEERKNKEEYKGEDENKTKDDTQLKNVSDSVVIHQICSWHSLKENGEEIDDRINKAK